MYTPHAGNLQDGIALAGSWCSILWKHLRHPVESF